MAVIMGIDPGFDGALAWYDTGAKKLLAAVPMPLRADLILSKETRREIDAIALAKLTHQMIVSIVVLEKVDASPKMGVSSAFRFGEGFGILRGILAAQGHFPRLAYPNAWKPALGLSSDKKRSIKLASELFPEFGAIFHAGKNSADLAEAALLAYYGARFVGSVN